MISAADSTQLRAECERTIRAGSKSFAAAARLFDRRTRESAYLLYAWCRHCDDRIDGQSLGFELTETTDSPRARLCRLREDTERALSGQATSESAFAALQAVVRGNDIPHRYPREMLDGFAMDVEGRPCVTIDDTLRYAYHVAGVVGVMMAWIMGVRDASTLDRAADLGIGMQLSNIARDVMSDARAGRVYLPLGWLDEEEIPATDLEAPQYREGVCRVVRRLVGEAERYYDSAAAGIARLPIRSAWAVSTARLIYRDIGHTVSRRGAEAWTERVSTSAVAKIVRVLHGGVNTTCAKSLGRLLPSHPRDERLFRRPGRRNA